MCDYVQGCVHALLAIKVCVCVGACVYVCVCVWLRVRRDSTGTIGWGVTNPSFTIY